MPFGVALHSHFGTRWTSFSQIRVALTMKHFIVMLAYIPICGVISTLILGKMNCNTKLFLQTSLCFKPSLWTTQRKWDMVVESFAIFMAFHATGPMVWLDFTSAIESHGDGIAERFSPGKLRKVGSRISNQVTAACLFRINFHSYLIWLPVINLSKEIFMFVVNILSISLILKPSKESNEALKFIKFKLWSLKNLGHWDQDIQNNF